MARKSKAKKMSKQDDEMEVILSEQVDPVSGNTAPLGAKPEEVRDDVEINVSPNEFVINAATVRYFGEDFFRELQETAAEGWERIKEGEEIPFRDDELEVMEEGEPKEGYAEGGAVPAPVGGGFGGYGGRGATFTGFEKEVYVNPETGQEIIIFLFQGKPMSRIPPGYVLKSDLPAVEAGEFESRKTEKDDGDKSTVPVEKTYQNTPVDDWTPEMHTDYADDLRSAKQKGEDPFALSTAEKVILGVVGSAIGGAAGGVALTSFASKAKQKQAEAVAEKGKQAAISGSLEGMEMMDAYSIMESSYEAAGALKMSPVSETEYNNMGAATQTAVSMAADAYLMTSYAKPSQPKKSPAEQITQGIKDAFDKITGVDDVKTPQDDLPEPITGTGSLVSPTNTQVIQGVATSYPVYNNDDDDDNGFTFGQGQSAMEKSIQEQSQAYQDSGKKFDMNDPSTWATSSNDDSGNNSGSDDDGCVIATHGVSTGGFSRLDKAKAELWCERTYHGKWYGEAFRRGYRHAGRKAIERGEAEKHYQEFKDFVSYGRGLKTDLKSRLNYYKRTVQFFATGMFVKD